MKRREHMLRKFVVCVKHAKKSEFTYGNSKRREKLDGNVYTCDQESQNFISREANNERNAISLLFAFEET